MPGKNIVVIFNDDHGQWALPAYGNRDLHTPTLNYLANTGVVMENAFTPTPVCSPARACFLTGRLASQHGLHDYIANAEDFGTRRWLENEVTLPEMLQRDGYEVALSGKWHLGNDVIPHPGFDHWFALNGDYPITAKGTYQYSLNGEIKSLSGFKSQIITDQAVGFLHNRKTDRPFFLFVGHTATHSPWSDHPERLVQHYRHRDLLDFQTGSAYPFGRQNLESAELMSRTEAREGLVQYYAAVSSLDEAVGRLLDELDALGLIDETLIVYTSDHGLCCGHHGIWGKGNGTMPLNMVEESIRIPMIFHHPGEALFSGQRRPEFVDHLDLFQTLMAFAGTKAPAEISDTYPGKSFLPLLTNELLPAPWRQVQFGEYGPVRMVRTPRYKLVKRYPDGPDELFDLRDDPQEVINLAAEPEHQSRIAQLSDQLTAFFEKHADPKKSGIRPDGPEKTNFTSPWSA